MNQDSTTKKTTQKSAKSTTATNKKFKGFTFNTRYATFGFKDSANLDEGVMWPTSFAMKKLTAAEEARISSLVKKAVR